jgi:hypothetical protein
MAAQLSSVEATIGRLEGSDDALHHLSAFDARFLLLDEFSRLFPLAPREAATVSPIERCQNTTNTIIAKFNLL